VDGHSEREGGLEGVVRCEAHRTTIFWEGKACTAGEGQEEKDWGKKIKFFN